MAITLITIEAALRTAGITTVQSGSYPCFIGVLPDLPNTAVGINYTGGYPQDTHQGENLLETFQVFVRAGEKDFATAYAKWYAVFNALENASLSDIYLLRAMTSAPLSFIDAKNRQCLTSNFNVVRRNGT